MIRRRLNLALSALALWLVLIVLVFTPFEKKARAAKPRHARLCYTATGELVLRHSPGPKLRRRERGAGARRRCIAPVAGAPAD